MTVLSSTQRRRRRLPNKVKFKSVGDHDEFLRRIKKTLYYGKIPLTERFSLPVSELAAELYSNCKSEHGFDRLLVDDAADVSRNACVSPCSLILALFYLERLKTCNLDYIDRVPPTELFVASTMVGSKFLHDDGEEDEVFNTEWATSAGIDVIELNRYEKDFLNAINWEVYVNEAAFWTGLDKLEKEVARREGRRRGWYTYTELLMMSDLVDIWSLAQTLVMVSVVCLTSYSASVLTLVGSAMISSQITSVLPGVANVCPQAMSTWSWPSVPVTPKCIRTEDEPVMFENSTLQEDHWSGSLGDGETEAAVVSPFTSVWYELGKSVDKMYSRLFKSFMNDNYTSLIRLNETKSSILDAVKLIIVAIETDKSKAYGAIDTFMENGDYEGSTVSIASDDHFNQLSYFLRTLKLPS